MLTTQQLEHDNLITQVADDYLRRGYDVTIEPSTALLPEFLDGFRPDILARGPAENVIVEVKTRRNGSADRKYDDLRRELASHPGWRFEMVLAPPLSDESAISLSMDEIRDRLFQASTLENEKMHSAALLMSWTAAEAAMREACRRNNISLQNAGPAAMTSALYSGGLLEREEYDSLIHCGLVRNGVAHGFSTPVETGCIRFLLEITERLLSEAATQNAA